MQPSLENLSEDLMIEIIKFQVKLGEFNPSMFSKRYKKIYDKYMRRTKWYEED